MNPTDELAPRPPPDEALAPIALAEGAQPDETVDAGAPAAAPEVTAKRKKKRAKKPAEPAGPEPFALYLARLYIAEKGYRPGTVPEAAALADACDVVLTYSDGMTFAILGIVDAERDPKRRVDLSADLLIDIGKACLQFTGRMNGAKLPVVIQIVEIRSGITAADKERLTSIHARRVLDKVHVQGFALAPESGQVWSTLTFGWLPERWFRRALTGPRRTAADLVAPAQAFTEAKGLPWLTIGLLAVITALFVVELALGSRPGNTFLTPPMDTLIALGGASGALVFGQGEWWRLFTATLLHGGPIHLVLNGVGLYFGGVVLENLLGRAWLAALFVIGALGGSVASVLINDPDVVSVGASGAIMGLLAAAMVASYRLPPVHRAQIQIPLVQILVPSLIPIAVQRTGGHIDFAAHFGGALTGALAGFALLRTWPVADPHPRFRRGAAALALAGAVAYLISFAQVSRVYSLYGGMGDIAMIPNEELSSLTAKDAPDLLAKYPRDPRSHLFAAFQASDANNLPLAEEHLRAALAEEGVLRISFPDRKLEGRIRSFLAGVLEEEGRHQEAIEAARPACDTGAKGLEKFCR